MKISHKVSIATVAVSLLSLSVPLTAFAIAATAPNLGTSASFSVFAGSAMTADGSGATISADLGVNPGLSASGPWTVGGSSYFGTGGLSGTAKTDATAAWTAMGSTGGTTWNPATVGATLTAGLYTVNGDATVASGNTLTLDGSASDVWIFQVNSSLTFHGNIALTGGASACNVYWRVASDATINPLGGAGTKFIGTLIANGNVSLTAGPAPTVVNGRMMALTGTLSTAGLTNISGCAVGTSSGGGLTNGTITVVKTVINDNGGTNIVSDFPLFVNGQSVGHQSVTSGGTNVFPTSGLYPYTVTETSNPNYTATFSGDCDANGFLNLAPGNHKVCLITNNDKGAPPVLPATITVIKTVINNNGGTRIAASFPLSVNGTLVVSGVINVFPVGTYTVNEIGASNYTRTFSGDCDSNGVMNLVAGNNKTCTITNTYQAQAVTTTTTTTTTAPKLPNTGLPPQSRTPWDIFITAGILMLVSVSLVLALKKRTV